MAKKKLLVSVCLTCVIASCGLTPGSGPKATRVQSLNATGYQEFSNITKKEVSDFNYTLVDVDNEVLSTLDNFNKLVDQTIDWPQTELADDIKVNIGDTIEISIFESQSGGLFIPADSGTRPGNFVTLPSQTINSSGKIIVPYVGEVQAAGKSTEEISSYIVDKLGDKAIEPQVVVSFVNRNGAEISVLGDVNNPTRLSLGFNNYKVLDVIAGAGGPSVPGYEAWVTLQRNNYEYSIPFDYLLQNPERNIYAKVNDTVYVYQEPKIFVAYGAVEAKGRIPFGKRQLMLSEALGLAQGLRDDQADPAEVYIYRQADSSPFTKKLSAVENSMIIESQTQSAAARIKELPKDGTHEFGKHSILQFSSSNNIVLAQTESGKLKTEKVFEETPMESFPILNALPPKNEFKNQDPVGTVEQLNVRVEQEEVVEASKFYPKDYKTSVFSHGDVVEVEKDTALAAPLPMTAQKVQRVEQTLPHVSLPVIATPRGQMVEKGVSPAVMVPLFSAPKIQTEKKDTAPVVVKEVKKIPAITKPIQVKDTPKVTESVEIVAVDENKIPVIFKIDMRNPKGFFYAQQFEMRDNDIIYVATAKTVELQKFLNIISSTSTTKINTRQAF